MYRSKPIISIDKLYRTQGSLYRRFELSSRREVLDEGRTEDRVSYFSNKYVNGSVFGTSQRLTEGKAEGKGRV